ncbi:hypothetical protein [uncultured Roseobacter sp.]|uniref:hypothetical protein n=1 Tax=uncultured Roseobacter sp. TaxID=114847 RepID=UPI002639890F|nr:hypothetical protein [uncultured Roseobacter sp.]
MAILLAGVIVKGCDQPMGASDGISPTAGMAPRANVRTQTVDPDAGLRPTPNPGGSGARAAGIISRYQSVMPTVPVETSTVGEGEGDEG